MPTKTTKGTFPRVSDIGVDEIYRISERNNDLNDDHCKMDISLPIETPENEVFLIHRILWQLPTQNMDSGTNYELTWNHYEADSLEEYGGAIEDSSTFLEIDDEYGNDKTWGMVQFDVPVVCPYDSISFTAHVDNNAGYVSCEIVGSVLEVSDQQLNTLLLTIDRRL